MSKLIKLTVSGYIGNGEVVDVGHYMYVEPHFVEYKVKHQLNLFEHAFESIKPRTVPVYKFDEEPIKCGRFMKWLRKECELPLTKNVVTKIGERNGTVVRTVSGVEYFCDETPSEIEKLTSGNALNG